MLIISYDAIGDRDFGRLMEYPAFSALAGQSAVFRGVPAMFVSNTYPVHVSVATGVTPESHGVVSNVEPFPYPFAVWNNREELIRSKTVWQAAAQKGIDTAAVFWPVTAYSKSIRYNVPEVLAPPGQNQLLTSIKAGSPLLQLKLFLRNRKLLGKLGDGVVQPNADNFAAASMADILRKRRPGLALVHLTAYDSICHMTGRLGAGIDAAYDAMDRNLSVLLDAAENDGADPETDVILFSDHGQIDVHTVLYPNDTLAAEGLIKKTGSGYQPGRHACFIECCGGSAFFHAGSFPEGGIGALRAVIERGEGFRRFITADEMRESGMSGVAAFGFCAEEGYCYAAACGDADAGGRPREELKANHGYPADMPDYKVFYMVRGRGIEPGVTHGAGSLLDISRIAARRLDLDFNPA